MKKLLPVLLLVFVLASVMVVPAFAQSPEPPQVAPPAFDWGVISDAMTALLSAILLPLFGFAARWAFAQGSYQKSLLSTEQQYAFDMALKVFVYAAEQMKLKNYINDKLTYVIERAEAWLESKNMEMDLLELRARIEAIVNQEFPKIEAVG